jgi:outer membrane protein OmpA-like peptidoglycan-associated protein
MKAIYYLCLLMIISFSLSNCVMYDGPIRPPYVKPTHHLPPPDIKKVVFADTKEEYLQKVYNNIQTALPEAEVTMIEDSIKVLFPNNITYSSGAIYPNSSYYNPLTTFSKLLIQYRRTDILITGHTDSKGIEAKNKEISKLRANQIKQILQNNGVLSYRLESWGLGSVSPIADNSTETGRILNRRVEFVVLYHE